jgi:hypothetical protein
LQESPTKRKEDGKMNNQSILARKQAEAREKSRDEESSSAQTQLLHSIQEREYYERELAGKGAPQEVDLIQKRMDGIFEGTTALLALIGGAYLIELSLKAFLSEGVFPLWQQRMMAGIFMLGTILCFHLGLPRTSAGDLRTPGWLFLFSVLCFLLLSVIRGLLAAASHQQGDLLRTSDVLSLWLGVISFCLLGLGLDIIAGLTGASAWGKLSYALPLLKWYRKMKKAEKKTQGLEVVLAQRRSTCTDLGRESANIHQPAPEPGFAAQKSGRDGLGFSA